MKKIILFGLIVAALTSCYKDDSTRADISKLYGGGRVYADKSTLNWLTSSEEEPYTADYTPILRYPDGNPFTEADYEKYTYRWRLSRGNRNGGDTTRNTIGHELRLNRLITEPVNTTPGYSLILEMVEKETGMQYTLSWIVYVGAVGGIGSGLLVADTRDGGLTSDITLVRATPWSLSEQFITFENGVEFPEPMVLPDLFSKNNGEKVQGRIPSIAWTANANRNTHARIDFISNDGSEGHIYRLNYITFEVEKKDAELFNNGAMPTPFKPQALSANDFASVFSRTMLVSDGKLYSSRGDRVNTETVNVTPNASGTGNTNLYLEMTALPDTRVDLTGAVALPALFGKTGMLFDNVTERILFANAATDNRIVVGAANNDVDQKFKITEALEGFKALYLGPWAYGHAYSYASRVLALLEKDGKRYGYIVGGAGGDYYQNNVKGYAIFDLSNCTDINKSTVWANSFITDRTAAQYGRGSNPKQPEFWYAVDNKIYTATLSINATEGTPSATQVFTFPEDEKITHMHWCVEDGSGYTFWNVDNGGKPVSRYPEYSTNNMMTVVTWNEDTEEGKLYAIPRAFAGSGRFLNSPATPENPFVFQLGGFGEITAIAVRKL